MRSHERSRDRGLGTIARRSFVQGVTAAIVIGFDPTRRTWIADAEAAPSSLSRIPPLDGVLRMDPASLAKAADDFGHTIHRQSVALLEPGSVDDIVKMVRYVRRHGLTIANRGRGHATYGQAQTQGGIVVDSSKLAAIHRVDSDRMVVDAGASWRNVMHAALARGSTPPVFTDYLDLSVGGTLSGGGVGGASHRHGCQIDNVLELEVVTGEGERITCSASRHASLFNSVLGGLGQFALIVRATLRLVPACALARVYELEYADLASFTKDATALALDERFDHLEGQASPKPDGGWTWTLTAASYFTPPHRPNDAALLAGLSHDPSSSSVHDLAYQEFLERIDPLIQRQKDLGIWEYPHPWYDVFVPASVTNRYVGGILDTLTVDDTGNGPVLLYPLRRSKLRRPFFSVPAEEVFFLFDVLRTTSPDPVRVRAHLRANRRMYDAGRALGATRYCIGSLDFSQADWRQHFGFWWPAFAFAKNAFDPDRVLTPGQGIFL
ncbi:FAD-binding protein [Pendulispora brunnea]|uniref:FAD-binding protein n=1 Tax=Pendulispora brunnea TaxID=2905690 RepID=A0ABZ2K230_9BACT